MRKFLLTLLPMLLLCMSARSEVVTNDKGSNFLTQNRKVVVVAPSYEDMEVVEDMLAKHGAKIMRGFAARIIYPRVTCKEVVSIDDSDNAFTIEVRKNAITIYYTSPEMRDKALKSFGSLFEAPYGQRIISGKYVEEILPGSHTKQGRTSVKKSNKESIVDGVTNILSTSQVQSAIRQSNSANFILAVVSKRIFRLNFEVFNNWNGLAHGIASDGAYSSAQMVQFVKTAAEKGSTFVPAIDLLSDNEVFEAYTGHKMSSVEGMRFVRSMVEQCAREWKVKKICIGRKSTVVDCRYLEFLQELAKRENIEFIIL